MRSEPSTPAATPPPMPPDADLRGQAKSGRWKGESSPPPTPAVKADPPPEPAESPQPVAAEGAAFWRAAEWDGLRAPRRGLSPWLWSFAVHCIAVILLGLWMAAPQPSSLRDGIEITAGEGSESGGGLESADNLAPQAVAASGASEAAQSQSFGSVPVVPLEFETSSPIDSALPTSTSTSISQSSAISNLLSSSGNGTADWGQVVTKGGGGGLSGRAPGTRGKLADQGGGNARSEEAVERGLRWLAAHQHEDGSWRFHFDGLPCSNACRNPGTESSSTGSTALALLPFFGAGYTHREGPYVDTINKGLYYLCNRMLNVPQGGDLQEGTMYAQGLATIVLCEAYAMSKDEKLRPYAQQAVKFVLYAQDQRGGGWRYTPGMPGDTTMTGWQLMALKSALLAGLEVPSSRFFLAGKFLDGVQSERGAAYGYRTTIKRPSTSAVGLLCRMYLGWNKTHPAVREGVHFFDRLGPSPTDIYMDYYATQLMFHHGGSPWDRWNKKMRDYLIQTQATQGHENGSWHFNDPHGNAGGRLYSTALAILTLEVYYRYLPLFSTEAVDGGF